MPRENAQAWLKHLRHTTPTLPFRSAGSHQRTNLSSTGTAPALLRLLKAYKPSAAQSMTVGVVGFPNVGKSSLINTLKRAKVSRRFSILAPLLVSFDAHGRKGVCGGGAAGTYEGIAVYTA